MEQQNSSIIGNEWVLQLMGDDKTLTWDHSNTNFVFGDEVSSSVGFTGDGSGLMV